MSSALDVNLQLRAFSDAGSGLCLLRVRAPRLLRVFLAKTGWECRNNRLGGTSRTSGQSLDQPITGVPIETEHIYERWTTNYNSAQKPAKASRTYRPRTVKS